MLEITISTELSGYLQNLCIMRKCFCNSLLLIQFTKCFSGLHSVRVWTFTVQTEICLERLTFMGCSLYSGNTHHGCSPSCLSHCSFIIVCLCPRDPPGFIYALVLSPQSRPRPQISSAVNEQWHQRLSVTPAHAESV